MVDIDIKDMDVNYERLVDVVNVVDVVDVVDTNMDGYGGYKYDTKMIQIWIVTVDTNMIQTRHRKLCKSLMDPILSLYLSVKR